MQRHIAASTSEQVKAKNPSWILTGKELVLADINKDSIINILDLILLRRHIAAQQNAQVSGKHSDWLIK